MKRLTIIYLAVFVCLCLLCLLNFAFNSTLLCRLLGTPNEEVWPDVSKLMNWHEYPQWNPQSLSTAVPSLDELGIDLLSVSYLWLTLF